jgi:uncharacterized phage protein gp47/JayE
MNTINNPWVSYINRSYKTIKDSLISRLIIKTPELSDHSESNVFIMLISMFSGLLEMLNYYIDNMARESFITTARRFDSVVKLSRLVDYRVKSFLPSSVDLTMTFNNPIPGPNPFVIPAGTIFSTTSNLIFTSTKSVSAPMGALSVSIPVKQQIYNSNVLLGTTSGSALDNIDLNYSIVDASINLVINNELWLFKDTLGLSGPDDLHFTTNVRENGVLYIQFGDGFNGKIPEPNSNVLGNFMTTRGTLGNLPSNSINSIDSNLNYPPTITATVTNTLPTTGGLDIENIRSIRYKTPLSVRTLDRAVTAQDYEDIAIMYPGVSKARLSFDCSKPIEIFIYPIGGGIASNALLEDTYTFIYQRKMVGTHISVKPSGESYLVLDISVTGKFRITSAEIQSKVLEVLNNFLNPENSEINKPVRKSDLYALIDNLPQVDFLNINKMYLKPYAKPSKYNTQLNWDITLNISNSNINWALEFNGTNFNLFKNNQFVTFINLNTNFTDVDNTFTLIINSGPYIIGEIYEFTTITMNQDLILNDFSIPIFKSNLLTLNITESNI